MPEQETMDEPTRQAQGKAPTTQAGIHREKCTHSRGQHGAQSTKQAIAIGLSKARRRRRPAAPRAQDLGKNSTQRQACLSRSKTA